MLYRRLSLPLVTITLTAALGGGVARAQSPGASGYQAVPPLPVPTRPLSPFLPPPARFVPTERPVPGITLDRPGYSMTIALDGTARIDSHFTFDLTDIVARWTGNDPYLSDKLELLDETREQRAQMRAVWNERVMQEALGELPMYLGDVWARTDWPVETRRRILFELWDEAAEDGNELIREGGRVARRTIEGFIASNLPAESEAGYSAAELEVLNRSRMSKAQFRPYDVEHVVTVPVAVASFAPAASELRRALYL